jgi:hypothetical protein
MNAELHPRTWHEHYENIVILCSYLASEGFTAAELVRVLEKPWKWRAEFVIAHCRLIRSPFTPPPVTDWRESLRRNPHL